MSRTTTGFSGEAVGPLELPTVELVGEGWWFIGFAVHGRGTTGGLQGEA